MKPFAKMWITTCFCKGCGKKWTQQQFWHTDDGQGWSGSLNDCTEMERYLAGGGVIEEIQAGVLYYPICFICLPLSKALGNHPVTKLPASSRKLQKAKPKIPSLDELANL